MMSGRRRRRWSVVSIHFDTDPGPGVANNGNVAAIVNNRNPARTQSFTYDELNRIATAKTQATTGQHCWGETFGYDLWGNLLTIGGIQPEYNGCTQENLSVSVTAKNQISGNTYDAAGNMTFAPGMGSYAYDAENRMISTAGVSYAYDGDGRRVRKSNGKLYWYGANALDALLETDLAGNNPTEYVFFNGRRIARRSPSGAVDYYLADHLGTSRVVADATGAILDDSDFYPFGGERVVISASGNAYKFTGKERDPESGLDYFGARYDSSSLGRFMSPDPGAFDWYNPQSLNRYTYALNNPLFYIDPDGEQSISAVYRLGRVSVTTFVPTGQSLDPAALLASPRGGFNHLPLRDLRN